DTFKAYLNGEDKNLDIAHAGSTRRFIATVSGGEIIRPNGLAWGSFAVDFSCSKPFGMDTSTTTALNVTGRTLQNYTYSYTWLGSAPIPEPIFTYTLTAITSGSGQSVMLSNQSTGQHMSITRDWTNGDVHVMNVPTKTLAG